MRTIPAHGFAARCLERVDEVARTGEALVVTRDGRPIVELRPCSASRRESPFGMHKSLEIRGDVVSPPEEEGGVPPG
jgi:antitoxin (DNA-binding transcriptional repressor) of toxin-antitoxin stability system